LPPELETFLAEQGEDLNQENLRQLIVRLCAWQTLTGEQLATLLKKDPHYLRFKHLTPMVRDGALVLRYPENGKHPQQTYSVPASSQGSEHD
jgi:ATP-dependent DNA helicase RecG